MRRPFLLPLLALLGGSFLALPEPAAGEVSREPELVTAARKGDTARVHTLIGAGADLNARGEAGLTALMAAAGLGHVEVARLLIGGGADVNASTPSGWTALMQAAAAGRTRVATVLIDAGADLEARDRMGGTALDVAQQANQREVMRLLRSRGGRGTGRAEGDRVCVRRWRGDGFCGVIDHISGTRYRVRLTSLRGCADGCAPHDECSGGERIGGAGGAGVSDSVWTRSWCVTDTRVP